LSRREKIPEVLYSQGYFALVGYPTFVARLASRWSYMQNQGMQNKGKTGGAIKHFLLADDNCLVRNFLRKVILDNAGWHVCGEASDGLEAVEQAERWRPHCVILDFAMPRLNGIGAAQMIAKRSPGTAILLISMHEGEVLRRHLTEEIRGFVAKSRLGSELLPAIEAVLAGGRYLASIGDGAGGVRAGL
jgi:CheY-like chemotaxis protein